MWSVGRRSAAVPKEMASLLQSQRAATERHRDVLLNRLHPALKPEHFKVGGAAIAELHPLIHDRANGGPAVLATRAMDQRFGGYAAVAVLFPQQLHHGKDRRDLDLGDSQVR